MAVFTTDAEIDAEVARAAARKDDDRPLAATVSFDPRLNVLIITLRNGKRLLIPREEVQGLASATPSQLANYEILGTGTALDWPDLDVTFSVEGLSRGIYGNAQWMAEIGKKGGQVKSARKAAASQANGLKGGRPRGQVVPIGEATVNATMTNVGKSAKPDNVKRRDTPSTTGARKDGNKVEPKRG